jgi:hypothetical protein
MAYTGKCPALTSGICLYPDMCTSTECWEAYLMTAEPGPSSKLHERTGLELFELCDDCYDRPYCINYGCKKKANQPV